MSLKRIRFRRYWITRKREKNYENNTLVGILTAASVVGAAHYAITGAADHTASMYVGIHAGWGAIAIDVIRTCRSRSANDASKNGGSPDNSRHIDQHHP